MSMAAKFRFTWGRRANSLNKRVVLSRNYNGLFMNDGDTQGSSEFCVASCESLTGLLLPSCVKSVYGGRDLRFVAGESQIDWPVAFSHRVEQTLDHRGVEREIHSLFRAGTAQCQH